METEVLIVGGGPSGIAVSACLNRLAVPNVVLEREDCHAPLWKKKCYDRVKLHLAKRFCKLPHKPHPPSAPTYLSRDQFLGYLDSYVAEFGVRPLCGKSVGSAAFDGGRRRWVVVALDAATGRAETYLSRFLVVASGENAEGSVPDVPGVERFPGEVLHSACYKSGAGYRGKRVLVVGNGNSGMEIAFDLCSHGAETAIAVRGPFHVVTKEMVHAGMVLMKYLGIHLVDALAVAAAKLLYGDLSTFGIERPAAGPFYLKDKEGRSPVIDVGTVAKIKSGEIEVTKEVTAVKDGGEVVFGDGKTGRFDAIVFATGYRSTALRWLKDGGGLLNEDGYARRRQPEQYWKGANGLYCAGLSRRGLAGVSMDATNIADDIEKTIRSDALRS